MKKKKRNMINNFKAFVSIRLVLLIVIVIAIILLTYVVEFHEPDRCRYCPDSNVKEFVGVLKGFSEHEKHSDYVNVRFGDNQTLVFDIWPENYMLPLLGYNCTIRACAKSNNQFSEYFDFMEGWINTDID